MLTDIRNENLECCKQLQEEIEHIEIRHIDGVKGNFTILDSKELLITDFIDKLGEPVNDALYSTQKEMTEAHIFMFEYLWRQSIPAHARFKELEKRVQPEVLQTIKEPHEIVETEHKLLSSAKDEILIIFHASNALLREINSGGIDLIVKQAIKYKTQIRILVPIDDKITDTVHKLERLSLIQIRNIEQVIQTRVTILVVDRSHSLVIAPKDDDTKQSSEEEIGLAAYSNSKSTVLSYVSIFESLWKHSQLREELLINSMAQQEFINIAAHELRSPIQPILGLSEILSRKVGNETVGYVNVIIRNARRLHYLAEDILDIAKIEAKTLKLKKQSFSFVKTILEVVQDYSSFTEISKSAPNVIISFSASEDLQFLNIVADQNRIKQVISNLVSNSLKFTKQGTIIVTVEKNNCYDSNKEELIVRVKDTGIGVAEDMIPKLFSKFVTKSEKGTGLGLYICKGIIEAHGGKIWAENNKEGKGATFSFSLPA
ncbi:MAG: HAMP domain-containing histidine kinase [Nitrososphaeraceae archaeon]|nr:HAMP domain-containing histidine kinase [Nitrososphaeraceae archaeon]